MVLKQPLATISHMVEWGHAVVQEEELRYHFLMSQLSVSKVARKQRDGKESTSTLVKEALAKDPKKLKQLHEELLQAQKNLKIFTSQENDSGTTFQLETGRSALLASSLLANTCIWNSTSSKLNCILKEVCS